MKTKTMARILIVSALTTVAASAHATCMDEARACAPYEAGTYLACAYNWQVTNGAAMQGACTGIASKSVYAECKAISSCSSYVGINISPSSVSGVTWTSPYPKNTSTIETAVCSDGNWIESVTAFIGAAGTLSVTRFGSVTFRCTDGAVKTLGGNTLRFPQSFHCNTGQLINGLEVRARSDLNIIRSLKFSCRTAIWGNYSVTTKTSPAMVGSSASDDVGKSASCQTGHFIYGFKAAVQGTGDEKNILGLQPLCGKPVKG